MPIDNTYDGYKEVIEKVTMVRDFYAGSRKVKAKKELYLPKLGGQTPNEYNAYLMRGYLAPVVKPTSKAVTGSIMRKPPVFENGALDYLLLNADGNKQDLNAFVSQSVMELLLAGGCGYLIEMQESQAFAKMYTKENITNIGANFIVLKQSYQKVDDRDKFKVETKTEYLELTFDENGNYIQNVWREVNKSFAITSTITPTNRGDAIKEIPFVFSALDGKDIRTSSPGLLELADSNADQYRMSTDQRHGLHWLALPTLFVFGDLKDSDGKDQQLTIGAGSANLINDTDARAELLEFNGAGLGTLKTAIDDVMNNMASIGASMLTNGGDGVKSAETARIESSSETAMLSNITNAIDLTMMNIIEIIAMWMNTKPQDFKVNRDFIDIKLDPNALMALLKTWMSGGMSLDSFLYQLEKGELLPPNVTHKDEANRIETTGGDFSGGIDE